MDKTNVSSDSVCVVNSAYNNADSRNVNQDKNKDNTSINSIFGGAVFGGIAGSYFLGGFSDDIPSDIHKYLAKKITKVARHVKNPIAKSLLTIGFLGTTVLGCAAAGAGLAGLLSNNQKKVQEKCMTEAWIKN